MYKSLLKEVFLLIKNSISRFVAIVLIVALGCGFYVGLRMSGSDMRAHEVDYLSKHNIYDVSLISTTGFDDVTIEYIKGFVPGDYQAVYTTDANAKVTGRDETIRFTAIDQNLTSSPEINSVEVVEGRLPQSPHECALSYRSLKGETHAVGDRIAISSNDDYLQIDEFEVVGLIRSPLYLSHVFGFTKLGSGMLDAYGVVSQDAFSDDVLPALLYIKADELNGYTVLSDDYRSHLSELNGKLQAKTMDIASIRNESIRVQAAPDIQEAQDKIESEQAKANKEIHKARATLQEGWNEYQSGKSQLKDGNIALAEGVSKLEAEKKVAYLKLDQAQATLAAKERELNDAYAQLPMSLGDAATQSNQIEAQITMLKAAPVVDFTTIAMLEEQKAGLDEILAAYGRIDGARMQIRSGYEELRAQRAEVDHKFTDAESKLEERKAELSEAQNTLDASYSKLIKGESNLSSSEQKAQEAIGEAREKVRDALAEVEEHTDTQVYVIDVWDNQSIRSYWDDASRMDNISNVFPLMFYLVAGLVTLTTMTRIVEESRSAIGTHRALGFSRTYIAAQYLLYATIASGVGLLIGVGTLYKALPFIIIKAYSFAYDISPSWNLMNLNDVFAYVGILAGIVIVLAACMAALKSIMKESAASLMLPRVPQAGKKILLERMYIWKRLSFSQKVTFRNLFRYKKRLAMTVVGIAGCTALILTALGLHDAIWGSLANQYTAENPANVASVTIGLKDDTDRDQLNMIDISLAEEGIKEIAPAYRTFIKVGKGEHSHALTLVVPQDNDDLSKIENMSDFEVVDDALKGGVILPPKLVQTLGVEVGDLVDIYKVNDVGHVEGEPIQVVLSAISNRSIELVGYTSQDVLQNTLKTQYKTNTLYGQIGKDGHTFDHIRQNLGNLDAVKTIAFTADDVEVFEKTLYSVDMVVVLLIGSAFVLCAIVLYSLIDINICERYREIATVKVLGFTKKEIDFYIYKDTLYGVILGILAGLLLGTGLEVFVVMSAESPLILFERNISSIAYLLSAAITLAFALIIMVTLRYKVQRIKMAESLKSID